MLRFARGDIEYEGKECLRERQGSRLYRDDVSCCGRVNVLLEVSIMGERVQVL